MNIVFAVKGSQGFLNGSEVSELLRNLSVVEFSFYLGYPVLQIAEREYCSPVKHWERGRECFRWWTSLVQMKYLGETQNINQIKLELLDSSQGGSPKPSSPQPPALTTLFFSFENKGAELKTTPVLEKVKPEDREQICGCQA